MVRAGALRSAGGAQPLGPAHTALEHFLRAGSSRAGGREGWAAVFLLLIPGPWKAVESPWKAVESPQGDTAQSSVPSTWTARA